MAEYLGSRRELLWLVPLSAWASRRPRPWNRQAQQLGGMPLFLALPLCRMCLHSARPVVEVAVAFLADLRSPLQPLGRASEAGLDRWRLARPAEASAGSKRRGLGRLEASAAPLVCRRDQQVVVAAAEAAPPGPARPLQCRVGPRAAPPRPQAPSTTAPTPRCSSAPSRPPSPPRRSGRTLGHSGPSQASTSRPGRRAGRASPPSGSARTNRRWRPRRAGSPCGARRSRSSGTCPSGRGVRLGAVAEGVRRRVARTARPLAAPSSSRQRQRPQRRRWRRGPLSPPPPPLLLLLAVTLVVESSAEGSHLWPRPLLWALALAALGRSASPAVSSAAHPAQLPLSLH